MNLIKLGHRYINLDNVYQISFNDEGRENNPNAKVMATLDVITSASTYEENNSPIEAAGMHVFGQEAEALRHYLDRDSYDLDQSYNNYLKAEDYRQGEAEWLVKFNDFADAMDISRFNGQRDSFRDWMQNSSEDLREPTPADYAGWQIWYAEWSKQTF